MSALAEQNLIALSSGLAKTATSLLLHDLLRVRETGALMTSWAIACAHPTPNVKSSPDLPGLTTGYGGNAHSNRGPRADADDPVLIVVIDRAISTEPSRVVEASLSHQGSDFAARAASCRACLDPSRHRSSPRQGYVLREGARSA